MTLREQAARHRAAKGTYNERVDRINAKIKARYWATLGAFAKEINDSKSQAYWDQLNGRIG